MNTERIRLLQAMPLFGGVSDETLTFLLERSRVIEVAAGENFFCENDEAHALYVLETGVVSIIKHWQGNPVTLHQLTAGDCFGEIALMAMMPRSATVRADTPCLAIELPLSALFDCYQENLEQFTLIQMNLGREICRRLRDSDARLFEVMNKS
ncbi:Crp/Fnr family transcriptional regulator [Marinobacter sp. F4216]|uniref:Crp/Fnr family transcriptional regulator n=1 Tax=Marinobacter sp. F4216 TaxID=2874281 RepID=UPI001CC17518|nr:cyclic nucleotide-binding domain-containing protein [Marinobacter sp. F4216]MBZ2168625.1 cyclic nucleotide-binding domain-containing protein [Marinobacter sp. F4216]